MNLDTSNHPKAAIALRYRKDLKDWIPASQVYLQKYSSVLLDSLEENPQIPLDELKQRIDAAKAADSLPYEDDELNLAFNTVASFGEEAVGEFKRTLDLLGNTVDTDSLVADLSTRYAKDGSPTDSKTVKESDHRAEAVSTDAEVPPTVSSIVPADAKSDQMDSSEDSYLMKMHQIEKVRQWGGKVQYVYNGRQYYSLDAAARAAENAAAENTRVRDGIGSFSDKNEASPSHRLNDVTESSTGTYIGAWFIFKLLAIASAFVLGIGMGFATADRWNGYTVGTSELFTLAIISSVTVTAAWYLTYGVLFKRLDPMKVMPYVYVLAVLGGMGEHTNMINDPFTDLVVSNGELGIFMFAQYSAIVLAVRLLSLRIRAERFPSRC